jgi:hypothetical protein
MRSQERSNDFAGVIDGEVVNTDDLHLVLTASQPDFGHQTAQQLLEIL